MLAAEPLAEFDVAFEEADPFEGGFGRGEQLRVIAGQRLSPTGSLDKLSAGSWVPSASCFMRFIASSMTSTHSFGLGAGLAIISRIDMSARNCAFADTSKSTEANNS